MVRLPMARTKLEREYYALPVTATPKDFLLGHGNWGLAEWEYREAERLAKAIEAKRKSKQYNGHKNWNYWNVSLWIGNDEGLYNLAREAIRATKNRQEAVEYFIGAILFETGTLKTPDGATYTKSAVRAAMVGFEK
jgi:hypothetical protein